MTIKPRFAYQDATLTADERTEDLLARLSLEDKAGLMFHHMAPVGADGELAEEGNFMGVEPTERLIRDKRMNHFNAVGAPSDARILARWVNNLQKVASQVGFGIPVTVSTDPRHAFTENVGTSFRSACFSQWPETLGLAALRDPELVEKFANIARQEYLAVGIRSALHPQIDLLTEPRWARGHGSFSEDADLTSDLGRAYVRGFQTESFGPNSVATMSKHFPGGGPQKDGMDPHFANGREQVYPGNNQEYHIKPFKAVIAAGTRAIMPYYGMPVGTDLPEQGFAFSKEVISDLLKTKLGFEGVVCTDWGLLTDAPIFGQIYPARAWGVEHLTPIERAELIINAGCDQFGGEDHPEFVVELVRSGKISEERIDHSVRKLLKEKFLLGLFENPYVDEERAAEIAGNASFRSEGYKAQRAAIVRLKEAKAGAAKLPLQKGLKIYVEGIDATEIGEVVSSPTEADLAIIRARAPFEAPAGPFESLFHQGSLEFSTDEKARLLDICNTVPTIFDIYLDRPAVFPEIAGAAAAITVNFGASAEALIDVLLDPALAKGKLPIDIPRSMEAVINSKSDVPFDTSDPLFRFGDGL